MFTFTATPSHCIYIAILPSLNQPVRPYPLRPINEPAVFVLGERHGQKVYPQGAPGPGPGMQERGPSMPSGIAFGNPQAMLAQQNSQMEALERRSRQDQRDRSGSVSAVSGFAALCLAYVVTRSFRGDSSSSSQVQVSGLKMRNGMVSRTGLLSHF